MKLIRYETYPGLDPVASMTDLREEMSRLFDCAFPNLSRMAPLDAREGLVPALDLYQKEDGYLLRAELPGLRREDIALEIVDGVLTISGERKFRESSPSDQELSRERSGGRFSRSVTLPREVQADKAAAAYENGILTVTLPKKEEAKPRKIAIEVK